MDPERVARARQFGSYLKERREAAGMTARALAAAAGTDHSRIVRMEQGEVQKPSVDLLTQIAEALEISVADILTAAGYPTSRALPNLRPYLRQKFRDLPPEAVDEVEAFIADLQRRHGNAGPKPGEDE